VPPRASVHGVWRVALGIKGAGGDGKYDGKITKTLGEIDDEADCEQIRPERTIASAPICIGKGNIT
jgi:hypothetical protein